MAYIGRDIQYGTFEKQVVTPPDSSTTVYTLDQGVADANNLLLSIGGVIQEPNVAFTAVGTVLTFTSAPAQGSSIWIVFLGNETTTSSSRGNAGTAITYQTGVGDGTVQPITLSKSVLNSKGIVVTLNGLVQSPETNYTASGTILTFDSAPSTEMNILVYYLTELTPISAITAGSITAAKLASSGTMPAWDGSALTALTVGNLEGTLPAVDGSALTGLDDHIINTSTNSGPLPTSNKTLGWLWMDTSTGELYCCTDETPNLNVWTNVGLGSGNIIPNQAPTAPTNATSGYSWMEGGSHNITFTGGTDSEDGTPSHYVVDNILPNDGQLTVNTNEVPAGSAHTFVAGDVNSNTTYTFRVRSKDSGGHGGIKYSAGVTITVTVLDSPVVAATGGNNNGGNGTVDGDYKYHIFTTPGTLNVTTANADITYLIVGGGGGGGGGNNGGGGGGGGDYVTGTFTPSVNSYPVVVGDGGPAQPSFQTKGFNGNPSSIFGITAIGGGAGGGASDTASIAQGGDGGSGGGGGCSNHAVYGTQIGAGIGNNGGTPSGWSRAGGGGGAGSSGIGSPSIPHGGNGLSNSIGGSNPFGAGHNYFAAGGGGGAAYGNQAHLIPGDGGNFGGGDGASTPSNTGHGSAGQDGSGSGGGGGGFNEMGGFKGGDGIVIVRYKYQ